jgi:hypothetical protein
VSIIVIHCVYYDTYLEAQTQVGTVDGAHHGTNAVSSVARYLRPRALDVVHTQGVPGGGQVLDSGPTALNVRDVLCVFKEPGKIEGTTAGSY